MKNALTGSDVGLLWTNGMSQGEDSTAETVWAHRVDWLLKQVMQLGGIHCKVKAGNTEKEMDWHHKTRLKGNWHVLGGSTRVLCRQKTLGPICLPHGL